MAKDGTQRGGARIGSGRKKTPLADRILNGSESKAEVLETPAELEDMQVPKPKKYISSKQKDGGKFYAKQIYQETWDWLKAHGCAALVSPQLIESYSLVTARHIQCEERLNQWGMLAQHPTTGEPIPSPFEKMSLDYLKQSNLLFNQIYQVVKENCSTGYDGANPQNDLMENLLRRVK